MTNKVFFEEVAKQQKADPAFMGTVQDARSGLHVRVYRKNGQIRFGRLRWTTRRGALLMSMSSRGAR